MLARQAADLIEAHSAAMLLQATAASNAFRLQLTDALLPLNEPDEIMTTAARLLGEHLQVGQVHYGEVDALEDSLHLNSLFCRPGDLSLAGTHRLEVFSEHLGAVLRAGRTLVLDDVAQAQHPSPGELAMYAAGRIQAYVITPLVRAGRLRAVFAVSQGQPRAWSSAHVALVEETAERTWAAVERAQADASAQRYARELERSNQALRDFAFIASHDLQEPLRKVQAFGELLEVRFSDGLGEVGQDYLRRMTSAAGRMSQMLQSLLDYSRVTSQGRPFTLVELNALAAEVLSDLEGRLLETGGRVKLGDLPVIRADALQMRQLLQNLIGNALKYHRPGVPPRVSVTCHANGRNQVSLTVQDNGIGFDMKDAVRLLEPFVRLHPRAEYEGSGMGLAICQKIVERHGGRLEFHSAPGQGATFTVVLPR